MTYILSNGEVLLVADTNEYGDNFEIEDTFVTEHDIYTEYTPLIGRI